MIIIIIIISDTSHNHDTMILVIINCPTAQLPNSLVDLAHGAVGHPAEDLSEVRTFQGSDDLVTSRGGRDGSRMEISQVFDDDDGDDEDDDDYHQANKLDYRLMMMMMMMVCGK